MTSASTALLVGFALRVAWAVSIEARPVSDASRYFRAALRLASHGTYDQGGDPTAYWPVGYPVALSLAFRLFGSELLVARALNVALGTASLALVYALARALGFSRSVAVVVLWLAALSPVYVAYTSLVTTETYFNCLMLGGAVAALGSAVPAVRLVFAGALFGLAALSRPHGLLLPALVGVGGLAGWGTGWAAWRPALRRVAWLSMGLVLVMSPWWVRNARAFDAFVPVSTNGGVNLYIGNNPHADGSYRFDQPVKEPLREYLQEGMLGGEKELALGRHAGRLARQYMASHPLRVLTLAPLKLFHVYLPDLTAVWWNAEPDSPGRDRLLAVLRVLLIAYQGLVMALGVWGMVALWRRRRMPPGEQVAGGTVAEPARALWLPLAVLAAFTAVHLVYFGAPRYHFPMLPWIELWAAYAIVELGGRVTDSMNARR